MGEVISRCTADVDMVETLFSAGVADVAANLGRLATAREADRVIVLNAGRLVETGTPKDVLRRRGRFAALVELEAADWDWRL
jgi:ABC-type hemin transport system ATPase subunit